MPDIKAVLNEEIRRLAKKEVKAAVLPLVKTIAEQRHAISELKKRIAAMEKSCAAAKPAEKTVSAPVAENKKLRLNAAGIVRVRTKLKLTQNEFAKLLGVSLHTVSFWELGKVAPRAGAKAAICALRTIGKREIKRRLAAAENNA
ncbi:MAG: helix-turn-helix domain-containing protein [Lentisphaerae bacterium]|nr:helix-turn-helix domain-containing protein [Lentisphaerota bacterium]